MSELTTNPGQEQDTTSPPMVFNPTPRQWGFTRSCVQLYGRRMSTARCSSLGWSRGRISYYHDQIGGMVGRVEVNSPKYRPRIVSNTFGQRVSGLVTELVEELGA